MARERFLINSPQIYFCITLVDFVYFRQKIPSESLKPILSKIDRKKLQGYLRKSPRWASEMVVKLLEKSGSRKMP